MNAPTTDDKDSGAITLGESLKKANEPATPDSTLFNISIRAWLAIMLTATVCAMSGMRIEITEPLHSLSLLAIGFYFGQKNK